MKTTYRNCIVLYTSESCKYCKQVKKKLANYLNRIVVHDVDKQGTPDFMPALPELVAYSLDGERLGTIMGVKLNRIYFDFFSEHKGLLK